MTERLLYLCRTRRGHHRHLTRFPGGVTLCGRLVDHLERSWGTKEAIVWADHWANSANDAPVCANCEAVRLRMTRDSIQAALEYLARLDRKLGL